MEEGGPRSDVHPSRPYRSARREDQARRTRRELLAAARTEFLAAGYTGTTMAAVAARAGVSVATVEKVFGTKSRLLKHVIDVSIVGDDDPVPALARDSAARAEAATDLDDFLHRVSGILTEGQQRSARLIVVALEAAVSDPTLGPLAQQRRDQRATVAEWIVDGIGRRAPMRPGLDRAFAVDVVWLLMDPAVFCRATEDRHWSLARYRRWFADVVRRQLVE